MSNRLTDVRIDDLTHIAETHERVTYSSTESILPLLSELKERRALDLTSEEREALESLWHIVHEWLSAEQANGVRLARHIDTEHALAILDRLVKGTP